MRSRAQSDAAASRRRLDPVESNIRRTRDEIDVAQALANLSRRPVNFPDSRTYDVNRDRILHQLSADS